jgi:hypothetical protein
MFGILSASESFAWKIATGDWLKQNLRRRRGQLTKGEYFNFNVTARR